MKIFITGAAGYIGGSVAEKLVAGGHMVSGLTRSEDKATRLKARGIEPVIGSLDDVTVLTAAAQAADAVIHAADADHAASVVTLVTALERSGKLFIHTTGSSIVADHADGDYAAVTPLTEDDYFEPVPFRRARVDMNRYVRQAAIEKGVRTAVIAPAMIYGAGRGLQPDSDQLPKIIALSRQVGAGAYFGKGLNVYSNVHIDDLVDLYLLVMQRAPGGSFGPDRQIRRFRLAPRLMPRWPFLGAVSPQPWRYRLSLPTRDIAGSLRARSEPRQRGA